MAFYPSDSGSAEPELIGTFSGNRSIDVSNYIRGNDTVNNFIVEIASVYLVASVSTPDDQMYHTGSNTCYPSKSLSGSTLTITNTSVSYSWSYSAGRHRMESSASCTYRVWHV